MNRRTFITGFAALVLEPAPRRRAYSFIWQPELIAVDVFTLADIQRAVDILRANAVRCDYYLVGPGGVTGVTVHQMMLDLDVTKRAT